MKKIRCYALTVLTLMNPLAFNAAQASTATLQHQTQADVLSYIQHYQPPASNGEKKLSFLELSAQLKNKRIVFVSEIHDRYDHHLNQLAILKAMHQQNPNIALGVEWFQQPFQHVVNAYLAGKINENELLRQTDYYERWRYDFRMLRPILEFAKANKIPVLALNAPSEITRKIALSGLSQLTPSERAQIPAQITPPSESYQQRLKQVFAQHSREESHFKNFALAQRVWDETMAANIVQFLKQNPQTRMVVLAGQGHMSFGSGIPADVKRQLPKESMLTIHSTSARDIQRGQADYFILSEYQSLPPTSKLGVWLDSKPNGVHIGKLIPNSAAAKAGLQEGDRITRINDQVIDSSSDLFLTLAQYRPGEQVQIGIERRSAPEKQRAQTLKLTLQ
ncbi:ChaN family lipoprotein [Thiolinea disciformis]|uniref:ChaN family lipoprotein n=1 Tax=Thiolinea disciformis TaxID=125614 RepID=UPI00037AD8D7|nr:ChaN family lipoprotein [Thiolinea disciformis]